MKGILHADSTKEKRQQKYQRSLSSCMWRRGDIIVMKKSPIIRARGACTAACVRSERGVCTAAGVSAAVEVAGTVEGVCCVLRGQKQLRCLAVRQ